MLPRWSIFEGLRSNTALQQLDLRRCGLDDQEVSILDSLFGMPLW
jgi:hypothetical protein